MRLLTVSLLALALVACAVTDSPIAEAQNGTSAVAPPTSSAATASQPTPLAGRPTSPVPDSALARDGETSATLALDGEGLRIFSAPSGASRLIAFGQSEVEAMRSLERVLGTPPLEQDENADCGSRLAIWPEGLTTWFADDIFVGWSVGRESGMSSAGGLRVGMSRQELENAATSVHIAPSSLGTEFDSAGMGGLLESDRTDARVSHLWAGFTCIAR